MSNLPKLIIYSRATQTTVLQTERERELSNMSVSLTNLKQNKAPQSARAASTHNWELD